MVIPFLFSEDHCCIPSGHIRKHLVQTVYKDINFKENLLLHDIKGLTKSSLIAMTLFKLIVFPPTFYLCPEGQMAPGVLGLPLFGPTMWSKLGERNQSININLINMIEKGNMNINHKIYYVTQSCNDFQQTAVNILFQSCNDYSERLKIIIIV